MQQATIFIVSLYASLMLLAEGARGETRRGLGHQRNGRKVKGVMSASSKSAKTSIQPKAKSGNDDDVAASDPAGAAPAPAPISLPPSPPCGGPLQLCGVVINYVDADYTGGSMADAIGYYSDNDVAELVRLTENWFLNAAIACFPELEVTGLHLPLTNASIGDDLRNAVDLRFNLVLEFGAGQFTASKPVPLPDSSELNECIVGAISVDYIWAVRDLEPFASVNETFLKEL